MRLERVASGRYDLVSEERRDTVYVAGTPGRRWAFWNGRVFREEASGDVPRARASVHAGVQQIVAPMPSTVLQVLVAVGQEVHSGDTLVIVEAMKMELPLRASADAHVKAVRCRPGELVQPETVLVELE